MAKKDSPEMQEYHDAWAKWREQRNMQAAENPKQQPTSLAEEAQAFKRYCNGNDILCEEQIQDWKRNKICRAHNLPEGTTVYFYREHTSSESFVVCDSGFSIVSNGICRLIEWANLDKVEYDRDECKFIVYPVNHEILTISSYNLLKWNSFESEFARLLTRMASYVENVVEQSEWETAQRLFDTEQYDEAIACYDRILEQEQLDDWETAVALFRRGLCCGYAALPEGGVMDEALCRRSVEDMDDCLTHLACVKEQEKKADELRQCAQFCKGKALFQLDDMVQSRRMFIQTMQGVDREMARDSLSWYEDASTRMLQQMDQTGRFTAEVPFAERQFVLFVRDARSMAGCDDESDTISWVFPLTQYPRDMQFPVGHPQSGTLYVAHPVRQGYYLPYETAEETLFMDKINEFKYLVQCLGATKISFRILRGETASTGKQDEQHVSGAASCRAVGGRLAVSEQTEEHLDTASQNRREWYSTFEPMQQPYCPEDTLWLAADHSWQRLVQMRLNGNQTSFCERITSSETMNLSSSKFEQLQASVKFLMMKASGKIKNKSDFKISQSKNIEWEIQVEFKPLDAFAPAAPRSIEPKAVPHVADAMPQPDGTAQQLTDAEARYREDVLFCLEDDGLITDDERLLLERKRKRLGISAQRAAEIEALCVPQLTANEQEWLEIYRELTADGVMTERKGRLLDRERDTLGITPERAKELEALAR